MEIKTKYSTGDKVFIIDERAIHKVEVLKVLVSYIGFNRVKIEYVFSGFNRMFLENEVFPTVEDLLLYLKSNIITGKGITLT